MFSRMDHTRVSLAYRYHNPAWDSARNLSVYGEDHSPEGLGGNLRIGLEIDGELDSDKLLVPENSLNPFLARVKECLDHRCLYEVEPWFETRVPTLENIAQFLAERIWSTPPPAGSWSRIVVEENRSWKVEAFRNRPVLRLTHSFDRDTFHIEAAVESGLDHSSGLCARRAEIVDAIQLQDPGSWSPDPGSGIRNSFILLRRALPKLCWLRVQGLDRRAWEVTSAVT